MNAPDQEVEERLLIEAAQKDPRRFAELYELHFERVYAFIARRVRSRVDAEDLTSEVFQQALANLARFEWRGIPFVAWLLRIASNAVADRWQQFSREQSSAGDPPYAAPEEIEEAAERALLFRMVGSLPTDQRRVVVQRFVEQKSIREIAQELGRSEGAVKQLQFRALENLRARMKGSNG